MKNDWVFFKFCYEWNSDHCHSDACLFPHSFVYLVVVYVEEKYIIYANMKQSGMCHIYTMRISLINYLRLANFKECFISNIPPLFWFVDSQNQEQVGLLKKRSMSISI